MIKMDNFQHISIKSYVVAELVMGRVCNGPSLYGPSLLCAEFVMGRVCYGPRCPVTRLVLHLIHSRET